MIDLHIHSIFSDGTDSVDDIINIVKRKNISAFSLTDHDTTYGVTDIIKKAAEENIKVIPGIEISSVSNGHMIHILGYNIDINNSELQELSSIIGKYYTKCFCEQYNWLQKNHIIDYDLNKILKYTNFKQSVAPSDILKAMIKDGASYTLKDWPEFYNTKIKQHPTHFIEKFPIHPSEAVEVIKKAGGIPTFAHPARIGNDDLKEMESLLLSGLGGLEVYYPYHDEVLIKRYEDFAAKHDLIKTGGTDWHGEELTTWNVEIGDYGVLELKL